MPAVWTAAESVPFLVALALMGGIGALQLLGVGADHHLSVDTDHDVAGDAPDLLGWLGFGRVPLLVLLVCFLAIFGAGGIAVQQLSLALTGGFLPGWLAGLGVGIAALPATGLAARGLARVLPGTETTAIPLDWLVGEEARITVGRATAGSPARARVTDLHGQPHYVMVEPNSATESFEEGERVLLVRREADGRFAAIARGDHKLPSLGV